MRTATVAAFRQAGTAPLAVTVKRNTVVRPFVPQRVDAFARRLGNQQFVRQADAAREEMPERKDRLTATTVNAVPLQVDVFEVKRFEEDGRGIPAE